MLAKHNRLVTVLTALLTILGLSVLSVPAGAAEPAAIKGQVLSWMDPLGFAKVTVFNAATGTAIKSAVTDGGGYYLIGGLPAGDIKVRATKTGYLDAWAGGASKATAAVYTLVPGQTLEQSWDPSVLYLDLTPESVITGDVMGFNNSPDAGFDDPLPGVTVTAFDAATGSALGSATTDAGGSFRIGMLRQGNVKLRASKSGWLTSWYNNKWTKASADVLAVQPFVPTVVSPIAVYAPAAIQGSVMVDDEPIARDVKVTVFDAGTGKAVRSVTDDDGYFTIGDLPPIQVTVRATGPFYTTGWANWQTAQSAATVFQLQPGVTTGATGSDGPFLNLISTGSIAGQVLGNFDPLGGARVTVFDAATGESLRATTADGDGHYRIDKIPVGFAGRDIKVRGSKTGWFAAWAKNATPSGATADTIHLYAGQVLEQSWDPMVLYLDLRPKS